MNVLILTGLMLMAAPDAYPRAQMLIEPAELAKPQSEGQFVILDARDKADYEKGHVPGARWIDPAVWAKEFGDGEDRQGWSRRIGELVINADSQVVVYDANGNKDAARAWWILRYWGVEHARLLNGGWSAWKEGHYPIQTNFFPSPAATNFSAEPHAGRLATKQRILDSLKSGELQIIDARSEGEFCGTEPFKNKRAGAIPGAKHLEWSDLIDKSTQRFKSAEELRKLFSDAGIDLTQPAATHCQSGGRASVMAFGLELMGATDVSNYYKSWAEWGNADDTPIVPGQPSKN